jgi:hypothetical protein
MSNFLKKIAIPSLLLLIAYYLGGLDSIVYYFISLMFFYLPYLFIFIFFKVTYYRDNMIFFFVGLFFSFLLHLFHYLYTNGLESIYILITLVLYVLVLIDKYYKDLNKNSTS